MWTYNIWPMILGEQIDAHVTMTIQFVLTQQQSDRLTRAHTRNIDRENQFDSGLREPNDPMHGVEGIFFSNSLMKMYSYMIYMITN